MQNDQNARHNTGQDCFYSSLDCSINKQKSHKSSLYNSYTIVMCITSREITSHDITLLPAWHEQIREASAGIARERKGQIFWCLAPKSRHSKRKCQSPEKIISISAL